MSDADTLGEAAEAAAPAAARPAWHSVVHRARQALDRDDDPALFALEGELAEWLAKPRREVRGGLPHLALYHSLIKWKRDGEFILPFEDAQSAKVQTWELDEHSADLEYKRRYIDVAVERFPKGRGFRMFQRLLKNVVQGTSKRFISEDIDVQIHRRPGATMTILGFSGLNGQYAGLGWTMFERAVAQPLNANLVVLRDWHRRIYLAGIQSLGDYKTSVAKVRDILDEFAHMRIVATGGSGGVFGAINFSADLGIRHIVGMAGPTSIEIGEANPDRQVYKQITADIDAGRVERVDLAEKVNNSSIERIDFFVAGGHEFDYSHMRALLSRCDRVVPHVYEELTGHIVTDYTIEDGSLIEAFNSGPQEPGLA